LARTGAGLRQPLHTPAHASRALDARADGGARMRPRGIKDSGARPPRSPGPQPGGNHPAGRWVQADTARDDFGDGRGAAEQGGGRDPWRLPSEDLLLALGIRCHGCSENGLVLVRCRKRVSVPCSVLAVLNASRTGVHRAAARPVLPVWCSSQRLDPSRPPGARADAPPPALPQAPRAVLVACCTLTTCCLRRGIFRAPRPWPALPALALLPPPSQKPKN